MSDVEQQFQQALQQHAAGNIEAAEAAYRQIVEQYEHAGALSNLGQLLRSQNQLDASIEMQQRACACSGSVAEMFFNLANALRQADRFPEAITHYQQAIQLKPELGMAHCALGIVVQHVEGVDSAFKHFQQAIELDQDLWRAWFGRAETGLQMRPALDAILDLQRAAQLAPQQLPVWRLLAQTMVGITSLSVRDHELLMRACKRWAELDTAVVQPLLEVANREWEFKNHEIAINALREAAKRSPDHFELLSALSSRLSEVHHVSEATQYCQQALKLKPNDMTMLAHAGKLEMMAGDVTQAVKCFGDLYAEDPEGAYGGRNWLFASLYDETLSAEAITQRHQLVTNQWHQIDELVEFDTFKSHPYRIGYLTPDLTGDHPVAQFFEPVLAKHNHKEFDVFVYSATDKVDETTRRCQQLTSYWRDVQAMDDQAVADQIRADNIDVLIDLAGHTKGARLSVLGYRPAPVQLCWLGYPYTTGHAQCDFLIADSIVCPESSAALYSEQLLNLPDCVFCLPHLDDSLMLSGPLRDKPIVFGNFGALQKITPKTFELWLQVLRTVPNSRLVLKNGSFADSDLREQFAKRLIASGISSNRFELRQPSAFALMMEEYNAVDVVLDTLSYNGGTTAFHALWMGVPTLTLPGDKFCNRMGSSIMHSMGANEWVADSAQAYVVQAKWAADNVIRLRENRKDWRVRLKLSPLGDHAGFAAHLEELYASAWSKKVVAS